MTAWLFLPLWYNGMGVTALGVYVCTMLHPEEPLLSSLSALQLGVPSVLHGVHLAEMYKFLVEIYL